MTESKWLKWYSLETGFGVLAMGHQNPVGRSGPIGYSLCVKTLEKRSNL